MRVLMEVMRMRPGSEEDGGDEDEGSEQDGGDDEEGLEEGGGDDEEGSKENEVMMRRVQKRMRTICPAEKEPIKDDCCPTEKEPIKDDCCPTEKKRKVVDKAVKIENRNRPDSDGEEDEAVASILERDDSDSDVEILDRFFSTYCRSHTLVDLMKDFSNEQVKSVVEIGFGGLLDLKLTRTGTTLLPWLVDHFDLVSWMFSISPGKEFVISPYDVYDVFELPLNNGMDIVETTRSTDLQLKQEWRSMFDVIGSAGIPLHKLEARIVQLKDGGELFKRLFVMVAFATFLAPVANRNADLSFIKALENVDEIKNFNWSSEVQEAQDCSLPLIKHWTYKKISDKVKKEVEAKSFGCGILDTTTYPISHNFLFGDQLPFRFAPEEAKQTEFSQVDNADGAPLGKMIIKFDVPDSMTSDEEIHFIATDVGVREVGAATAVVTIEGQRRWAVRAGRGCEGVCEMALWELRLLLVMRAGGAASLLASIAVVVCERGGAAAASWEIKRDES
uniref:Uncharacterized protein n=1 Tax=Chenopodium quinoa TaxID=63459 RepID=A0A803N9M4_CHEQI